MSGAAEAAAPAAAAAGTNPFLAPLVARWRAAPDALFAILHESAGEGAAWHPVTLDTTMRRAARFAAFYRARGVAPGETVMLILSPGLDAYAGFLGAMLAGAVPSFLPYPNVKQDATLYWKQHRTVFAHARPRLVLVYDALHAAMVECAEGSGAAVLALGELAAQAEPAALPALPAADAIGLLQHSSGTTGLKKGVALSYASIARQLAAYRAALGLDPARARIVSWLPLYHDMGLVSSFLLPAWLGVPIIALDPFVWVSEPGLFFDAVEDHGATHAWLPNFAFLHLARRLRAERRWELGTIEALVSCSEPCKPEAFDAFLARFADWGVRAETLQTCYAMAETVFAVSQSVAGAPVRRLAVARASVGGFGPVRPPAAGEEALTLLSNGPPVAECALAILRDGGFVAEDEIGEICVAAPFMFSGYYNNPAATAAAFHEGWYRTGDIGFINQGEIFVVGRIKDVIIVNGKNVFAHDVEAAVSRVAGVKPGRCVAFGHFAERMGSEQLVVVAERAGAAEAEADAETARRINHAVVEEVGIPCADVRMVDAGWLVKTTSGKTSRSENAARYAGQFRA